MNNDNKPIIAKAGIVPYRIDDANNVKVLLVTARRIPDAWVFPVGKVKPGETLEAAAARECAEESGYLVEVGTLVGMLVEDKPDSTGHFTFYWGKVVGETDEWESDRQRKWVSLETVDQIIYEAFVEIAYKAMESGLGEN